MLLGESHKMVNSITVKDDAVLLMMNHQYVEAAILLLQKLERNKDASILFNLGLCCLESELHEEALKYLEEGLMLFTKTTLTSSKPVIEEIVRKIQSQAKLSNHYRQPMFTFEIDHFKEMSRDRFLRVLVDVCYILKNKQRIIEINNQIGFKEYKNIDDIMRKIKEDEE
ncbi:tetratricopeptide (TPR) repeat protein [Breznakia sp. PF5-3]|uniref:tetratricopeptide repeat protein n=1 Tax=unclassified Breznakia TaxID=2623764 RepID=UPI002405A170|nr:MULTISPECIES: tetratricopeptide repeat protein [unclassified Breznakia]MDL2276729.1 tetratricopeptide repeat protein [Breznakia sp. OttesenSCG-928-G09]MDF9825812.1 tetratricopeptide (TPR) repeat protein [Breznakia sp. PM6-1]MDF9836617.1 tetratricopeptide (TPR) repeat protein [Breznakia sp. PF5-3]MDF9838860.1 tetratricopeptide (TPR) repeat protein [Breznakia sp. PFB2-8]MDF9860886.1 tetratricopeptide (TPR) repeat protein [Breznakia sp. PH5-24]